MSSTDTAHAARSNRLLAALSPADFAHVSADFERVPLPRLANLEYPGRRIEHLYFIESGIASMVSVQEKANVEVGLIGNEGMTGTAVVNGTDRSPYATFMQVAGAGYRVPAATIQRLMDDSESLRKAVLRYTQSFLIQVTQTAVANARATIEQRLARWLLMSQDRVGGDDIPLTHEFLAVMMGAGRPGVTSAVHALARKGMIKGERGVIRVLDRDALVDHASQYYGIPEKEYERLLSEARPRLRAI